MFILNFTVAIFTLLLIVPSDAARILGIFPVASISHQVVFRPLTQELARRGHELVILTPDPAFPKGEAPNNITEIDVHDLSYNAWINSFVKLVNGNTDSFTQMKLVFKSIFHIFDLQMNTTEVQDLINDEGQTFDLILTEACVRLALAFTLRFKAPVIQVSSFGGLDENFIVMGAPIHPYLYPDFLQTKLNNLTIWEKIKMVYMKLKYQLVFTYNEDLENAIVKKHFGADAPSISSLQNNVEMLFLNVNPIWEGNRPVPPGIIYMGGLHMKPRKELPKDLKNYLDSSVNGVIYISFGTNVDPTMLPSDRIQLLVNVFSRLPYDILWKWNGDVLPGQPKNVKISKWLPQSDLLSHPKLKLFITQGGIQSTDEAIIAGVPLLGIPMFADQWYNVEKYVANGIGLRLDMDTLTEESFENAITTIIEDQGYRENVVKLSILMRDQPQTPLERAVWWTEHVIRHKGAKHLRAPAANMSWAEYLALDVVLVVTSLTLLALAALSMAAYYLLSYIYRVASKSVKIKAQ